MATTQCETETPQREVKFKCSTEKSIRRMLEQEENRRLILERRAHFDALTETLNMYKDLRKKGIKVSDYKIRKKKQEMKKEFPDGKPKF